MGFDGSPADESAIALEEKLAFTATLAGSYAAAGQLAAKWSSEVADSVIHALVQRVGSKAEAQTQERLGNGSVRENVIFFGRMGQ